jgi:hypothetical protein
MDVRGYGQDGGVNVGGVVAQFKEEGGGGGVGDGQRRAGVAVGDGLGVVEGGCGGDVGEQEEIAAGDGAGLGDVRRALQLREDG